MFPLPHELAALLTDLGLHDVRWESMTNGISIAHVGTKQEAVTCGPGHHATLFDDRDDRPI
jgi:hypothetical protein